MGVSAESISFLQDRYRTRGRSDSGEDLNVWEHFPASFPFHRIRALRIRVMTPQRRDCKERWGLLRERVGEVGLALRLIGYNGRALKKLIIDAWEINMYHGPVDGEPGALTDIRHLFKPLRHSIQNVESCEIRLQGWARTCPRTIEMAKECGRAMMSRPLFDVESSNEPGSGPSSAGPMALAHLRIEAEPVILIQELVTEEKPMYENEPEFGTMCTSWGTVCTRL